MEKGGVPMPIEMRIGVTLLVTGLIIMCTALAVDDERTVKRILCGGLTAIYAAAMVMIWGG
jgi:hypothetical protein